ncbi:hypothetical protein GQ53DRAFT_828473 [Thozetella sp. PMI_491]|nr:hypothetical protein GQ53DRAFT_828473 [Thozetella sp. PMI_491]
MRGLCLLGSVLYGVALNAIGAAAWTPPPEYKITASPDGHFFQDSTGAPFFWQADTAWLLFHRLNRSEAEIYLSDRAAKGYNMILAVGFTQIGISSPNRNGDLTFINLDPTKPNEAYWSFVDDIVELAWSKGIRIAMVPCWGSYIHSSTDTGNVINATTARPFGEFIGARYPYLAKTLVADTNPYWTNKTAVKADYAAGGVPPVYKYTDWSPIYDDLANGITEGERKTTGEQSWRPMISIHPTNQWFEGGPVAVASAFLGDRDWLTFDTSQSGHADFPPNAPIPWWSARRGWEPVEIMYATGETRPGKKRPAVDNEAHYENRYNNGNSAYAWWNASDVRIGSWQAAFSGAAGVTYGADMVMQMANPQLFSPDGSGPANSWAVDINLPGASQMQYIQKAVLDRGNGSYFSRVPAQDILVGSTGTNDARITATRDSQGTWIMVYTPTGTAFSVDLKVLKVCKVQASWYDPLSGKYTVFNYTKPTNGGTVVKFTPPKDASHPDWLLVLEKGQ